MNKEVYEKSELEIIRFLTEDTIITSDQESIEPDPYEPPPVQG